MKSNTRSSTPTLGRRAFVVSAARLAVGAAVACSVARIDTAKASSSAIKAVAFDMFTIFDARGIDAAAEHVFPGKGAQLGAVWRARIFDYCWLRTLTHAYADFEQVAREALDVSLQALKLEAEPLAKDELLAVFTTLKPFPDSLGALQAMHRSGLRFACLSQFTEPILRSLCKSAGIDDLFEHYLSTDRVSAYKPDPRAYAMAEQAFALPREQIAFAAFGGWDAAGAKTFGLTTFWVNRFGAPADRLGAMPDATGATLVDLQRFLLR